MESFVEKCHFTTGGNEQEYYPLALKVLGARIGTSTSNILHITIRLWCIGGWEISTHVSWYGVMCKLLEMEETWPSINTQARWTVRPSLWGGFYFCCGRCKLFQISIRSRQSSWVLDHNELQALDVRGMKILKVSWGPILVALPDLSYSRQLKNLGSMFCLWWLNLERREWALFFYVGRLSSHQFRKSFLVSFLMGPLLLWNRGFD